MGHRLNRCSCGNKAEDKNIYCLLCEKDMTKTIVTTKNNLLKTLIESLYEKVKYEK